MKNKLTKNWGLKVVSFLFAASVWLIVTNINDPLAPLRLSDVPVTIRNKELITERGQTCEVLDNTDVIDLVTIYAPRSVIDSLDKGNVVAIADLKDLTSVDTVPIKLSTNKYNEKVENIKGNIDSVKLNIENKQTRSFPLRVNVTGEIREGYMLGDVGTEQNLIRISGPESIVSQISRAQAEVDISSFTGNINTETDIRLYDSEENAIESASLEKSITRVRVNVEILEKKVLPVNYVIGGTPAEGYRLTGETQCSKSNVTIAGKSSLIQNINAIEIPEGVIDVTGAEEDVITLVDLNEYLPEGTVLAEEDFTGKINITVYVGQEIRRTFLVPKERIHITGVPAGFEAEILEDEESQSSITLIGLASELQEIDTASLEADLDIAAWMEREEREEAESGYFHIPLSLQLPADSAVVWDAPEVFVRISEKE